jgi:lantibiotic leader peptide-processing serine protease
MLRVARFTLAAASITLALTGCQDSAAPLGTRPTISMSSASASENGKHIVVFTGDNAPADFAARVSARGGTIDETLTGAGLAIVSGLTDAGAADLAATDGVRTVAADETVGPDSPDEPTANAVDVETVEPAADVVSASHGPAAAKYYARQWNLRAIKADAAWEAGFLGSSDVSVFLLDTGIDYLQPDLVGRVDLSRSISLVPTASDEYALADAKGVLPIMDFHSHATGVASLIASNGDSLAGVTQRTTLVSVKVLDRTRRGTISVFLRGIVYAADHGADVIHFSFAFEGFDKSDSTGQVSAFNKATAYAHRKGAVMVIAGGNLAVDMDHNRNDWTVCNATHAICVSATGPIVAGGVNGPWTDVDTPAPYTNYGRSAISVAGPGGTSLKPGLAVTLNCSLSGKVTTGNPAPCGKGARRWESTGTSFAAAVTSGLAALLVSRVGHGRPDQIREIIQKSADDLGEPGTDPYYGKGRINVAAAMEALR